MDFNTEHSGTMSLSDISHNWVPAQGRGSAGGTRHSAIPLLFVSTVVAMICSLVSRVLGADWVLVLGIYQIVGTVCLFSGVFLSLWFEGDDADTD